MKLSDLRFHLSRVSSNAKTGPIPVTTNSRVTCPDTCPFKENGCYADNYGLNFHWDAITKGVRGVNWKEHLRNIATLPADQLWRACQAGDLPHKAGKISRTFLRGLIAANRGKRGFTYSHHKLAVGDNLSLLRMANRQGFTVNVSTESESQADAAVSAGLPAVVVVPGDESRTTWHTSGGNVVLICPAQRSDTKTCADCGLCQARGKRVIIGFLAHGTRSAKVEAAISAA
jgi:hypothetical protein